MEATSYLPCRDRFARKGGVCQRWTFSRMSDSCALGKIDGQRNSCCHWSVIVLAYSAKSISSTFLGHAVPGDTQKIVVKDIYVLYLNSEATYESFTSPMSLDIAHSLNTRIIVF